MEVAGGGRAGGRGWGGVDAQRDARAERADGGRGLGGRADLGDVAVLEGAVAGKPGAAEIAALLEGKVDAAKCSDVRVPGAGTGVATVRGGRRG